ncbi:hypothetical protein EW145_g1614 [Phellinidium pouzarii]|uniref:Uncharacterized protein n=1 Tax=Phellinidium pouzarii TaxID=167371 RepID=A0A4S4LDU4_9AGAM|nr:hypothetical protein EW145_g1614 [Phellinidium pouzarii]
MYTHVYYLLFYFQSVKGTSSEGSIPYLASITVSPLIVGGVITKIGYYVPFWAGVQVPFLDVQAVLSAKDMPVGNVVIVFFNSLGGAISISIAQNPSLSRIMPLLNQPEGVLVAYIYAIDHAFIFPIAVAGVAF